MTKSDKFLIILLTAIVLLCAALAAFFFCRAPKQNVIVKIYSGGILAETIDLSAVSQPRSITVNVSDYGGIGDGYNIIEIEQGRIRVADANCRGHECVRQGWAAFSFSPIVCLPNKLVIQFEAGTDIDGVVR